MRPVICSISVLLSCVVLTACGQSGALQLPSDPNHDKRAKYLLYKNETSLAKVSSDVNTEDSKVDNQTAQPSTQSQTTSP
ncbi:hypothetical protein GPS47_00790 [Acinetobacter haemolyticus]|uniref:LPS translocon maturation chaperone LptM n=1 Tax=Acinetobacter haemolyticus TaxID=29430 RepID=UPI000F73EC77|nr:lipoprotein [Acinetobacter haemolyticus]NAS04171.1 hypothetical protein [Acinetobacter haemolyticus]RSN78794.1 hypothetical protein EA769_00120 [Acinetobacter haemolyticus]WPO68210.1 lipoprotein [Acinetobacter haemolyticus]